MVRYLWFNETIKDAVLAPRLHHQLLPMELQYESAFDKTMVQSLANIGHVMKESMADQGFASLTVIAKDNKKINAYFDPRRGGSVSIV